MSHTSPTATFSSNFPPIFENSLKAYERRTKKVHPLAGKLQACDSPSSILVVFQQQVREYQSGSYLPTPMRFYFNLVRLVSGLIVSAFKKDRLDRDGLLDISKLIEAFLRRLEIYSEISLNQGLMDAIMEIMVEILCILAIVTKEMKLDRMLKRINKLNGQPNIERALKKLNQLTQEEARMATAQALNSTHTFDDRVRRVTDKVLGVNDTVAGVDDRVASVDDRLRRVTDNVLGVDDRVAGTGVDDAVVCIDDRMAGVNDIVAGVDDKVKGRRRRGRGR